MGLKNYLELNDLHKDVLQELGNVGTGNAITALSQLTKKQIDMYVPQVKIINYTELPELLGEKGEVYAGVILVVTGDIDSIIVFILNENFTKVMLHSLLDYIPDDLFHMSELEESAICEVGNVMCNSYLNAMAIMADLKMNVSVPTVKIDSAEGILDTFVRKHIENANELLFIENTFYCEEQEMVSHILLHPKFHSLKELLQRMGAE